MAQSAKVTLWDHFSELPRPASFKNSVDISNSLFSWSNSSDPCSKSWIGVTCDDENRVTQLVLQDLDLTGSIQTLTQLNHLRLLSLKNNNLSLSSEVSLSSWQNMKLLYLSNNQFTGNFPTGISQLHRLRRLDLSRNRFSGEIPVTQLLQLPHLLTLRLEDNSFTGSLPPARPADFLNLMDFNVSRNNLSGEIPEPFNSFPVSSFTGNKNLCGKPLPNKCFNQTAQSDPYPIRVPPEPKHNKLSRKTILAIAITDVSLVILMMFVILILCQRRRKQRNQNRRRERQKSSSSGYEIGFVGNKVREKEDEEMVLFEGCLGFGVDDLLKSSAEMLGKGSVGTTYKVMMDNGDLVVVKRARERKKKKEIDGLLRDIGGLRHRNLVSLRAYYGSRDELLLIYDFLPNGSLHSLLHGNRGPGRTPLDWTTRLKFAAGAAEGLAFLHTANKSKLSHGHLTSSNIVIDQEGNACISDVALHQLFLTSTPSNSGYKAPELMHSSNTYRMFSQKCDVYSFGVILLEILTGKMAFCEGETSLVKWVQCVVREEWTSEVFDIELLRDKDMEEDMVALLQIALLCLAQIPGDRPKMSIVYKMIEDVKTKGCRRGIYSPSLNDISIDSSASNLSDDTAPTFTSC
ncbi:Protein kinase domain [Macleaya cordata]|uniref:Protein kinase domain n=1 Tax=Macleaya cordata TaxID=56857 RepID=A0A200QD93_MACCD|nr:Protein kinase domain [Macleaya cordata]